MWQAELCGFSVCFCLLAPLQLLKMTHMTEPHACSLLVSPAAAAGASWYHQSVCMAEPRALCTPAGTSAPCPSPTQASNLELPGSVVISFFMTDVTLTWYVAASDWLGGNCCPPVVCPMGHSVVTLHYTHPVFPPSFGVSEMEDSVSWHAEDSCLSVTAPQKSVGILDAVAMPATS